MVDPVSAPVAVAQGGEARDPSRGSLAPRAPQWARVAACVVVLTGLGIADPVSAAVCDLCPGCLTYYYVRACDESSSPACSDDHDGRSPETAWATLRHAAAYVNGPNGNAGDAVIVGPGVYREGDVDLRRSGLSNPVRPVQFLGDATGTCTGDRPGPVLVDPGQAADTGFLVFGASNVVVAGFQITNARVAGVQVRLGPAGELSQGAVVANNVIFGNGDGRIGRGVDLIDAAGALVFNNLIYRNSSTGIGVQGTPDAHILDNTVYGNGTDGIVVGRNAEGTRSSTGAWLLNNIVANVAAGRVAIDVDKASGCDYIGAFNLLAVPAEARYSADTPSDPSDLLAEDARFAAPADGDFALAADSPALNAGPVDAIVLGLHRTSAAADGSRDSGQVDLGFHAAQETYPRLTAVPLPTAVLYVRADGTDTADGSSSKQALATIGEALRRARAKTRIVVGPGVYPENVDVPKLVPAGPLEVVADTTGQLTGDAPGAVLVDAQHRGDGFSVLARCSTVVDGFAVTNAQDPGGTRGNGISVKDGHNTVIRNNVTFSNAGLGIRVADSDDVLVRNNLVYANGDAPVRGGGIQVGGDFGSQRAVIESNTCYANGVNGILVGTGTAPSTHATVRYNILQGNGGNGVQIGDTSHAYLHLDGYKAEYNLNAEGRYGAGTPRPASDLVGLSARFIDPAGGDGILGTTGFADDDFRLAQVESGQSTDSPALDLCNVTAGAAALAGGSTRSDGLPDSGPLDAGYHYPAVEPRALYVSTGGSDTNSGVVAARPLKTLGAALGLAKSGMRVIIDAGTFAERNLHPPGGVTLVGAGSLMTVLDGGGGPDYVIDVGEPGVSLANLAVTGSARTGVRVLADNFEMTDCRVFGNGDKGVFLASGSEAILFNNLVYDNDNTGVVVGSPQSAAPRASLINNTIVGNGNRGVSVGLAAAVPSSEVMIVNNVVAGNFRAGVEIDAESLEGAQLGYNCNADGYVGVAQRATDVCADPLLVDGASAAAEFYLAHRAAGQENTSPCVDRGQGTAALLGLESTWTRSDGQPDSGRVDIGYHHGGSVASARVVAQTLRECPGTCTVPSGDCNGDGTVTVDDLVTAVNVAMGAASPSACPSVDVNGDGMVTVDELVSAVSAALGE